MLHRMPAAAAALAIALAAGQAGAAGPAFEDVTAKAGLDAPHHLAAFDPKIAHMNAWFSAIGNGAAAGDYDGDGDDDLYVIDSGRGQPNHLYRNNGDGTFTDVAAAAGVAELNRDGVSTGALWFDRDNDGRLDLLVVRYGQSRLFRNDGDGAFTDVTEQAGLSGVRANALTAVAFDLDRDGDLDLLVASYFPDVDLASVPSTRILHNGWETADNGGSKFLLVNDGDGTFTDVTAKAGLARGWWTLAVGVADYDDDGWPDLYLANDFGPDKLFRNRGDGTFEDVTHRTIGVDAKKGMNADWGDYDGDGRLDLYVTNITEDWLHECNMLWRNNGDGTFTDAAEELGACDTGWGWAGKFLDYDNDGWLDLYVANGFISAGAEDYIPMLEPIILDPDIDLSDAKNWPPFGDRSLAGHERNVLLRNEEGRGFRNVSREAGVDLLADSRGVVVLDLDGDGALDLFVTNRGKPPVLYRNASGTTNHWLELTLVGTRSNRFGVGARVTAEAGGRRQVRELAPANGFNAQSTHRLHFGLGGAETVDRLEIRWPSGLVEELRDVRANRILTVVEGEAGAQAGGAAAGAGPAAAREAGPGRLRFEDVTAASGLRHRHEPARFDEKLENVMGWVTSGGAGVAVGDYDRDGFEDVYLVTNRQGRPNRLYRNNGDGTFTDVAAAAGVAELNREEEATRVGTSSGALFVDIDNDGWLDLYLARMGEDRLFRNNRDGTFADITEQAGLAGHWDNTLVVVPIDYDRDGFVDVYVGNYFPDVNLYEAPHTRVLLESWEGARNGGTNRLLRNNGDGTFTDATDRAGVGDTGWTLAIGVADYDDDGWPDLYLANDFGPDRLFRNRGDGTFEDVSQAAIGIDTKKGMNADWGDFDNDGWLDLYVTNITEPWLHECNMLWRNNGDGTFTDVADELGVCDTDWGWAAKWGDFDNDGWLDLYVANGFISAGPGEYVEDLIVLLTEEVDIAEARNWPPMMGKSFAGYERKRLFHSEGGRRFRDVAEEAGVADERDGRGVVLWDLDNDGALDLLMTNVGDDAVVYRNVSAGRGHWIGFELEGVSSNRYGVGTRLVVEAGGRRWVREVAPGNGFSAQSSYRVHVGLGAATAVDRVELRWPSGTIEGLKGLEVDRYYRVREGAGLAAVDGRAGTPPMGGAPAGVSGEGR